MNRAVSRRPTLRLLVSLIVLGVVLGVLLAATFGAGGHRVPAVQIELLSTPTGPVVGGVTAAVAGTAVTPPTVIAGFAYPIAGGCLPQNDDLMPGALRRYRNGIHEGVDFYDVDNCTPIGKGTDVLAAKAGTVIRADLAYQDLTLEEVTALEQRAQQVGGSDPAIEDAFRGRQVWIDHGDGTVTRYAHLSGIAGGIERGKHVDQGELVAYVGDSGTPESVTAPGTEEHLHFEIRVGDIYLGKGLPPDEVRRLYKRAFTP